MSDPRNQIEAQRNKILRLRNKLANGMLSATDYNFYLELYQIAKLQYVKMKQTV